MSKQGAVLQDFNQQLVKNMELLKSQREKLNDVINKQELDRTKILKEIEQLNHKLLKINESISEKSTMRDECDKTLEQCEDGIQKLIESAHILVTLVKQENSQLEF